MPGGLTHAHIATNCDGNCRRRCPRPCRHRLLWRRYRFGDVDPSADITEQTLTVSIWSDYSDPELAANFEEATGVKTTIVNHTTNEDIVTS